MLNIVRRESKIRCEVKCGTTRTRTSYQQAHVERRVVSLRLLEMKLDFIKWVSPVSRLNLCEWTRYFIYYDSICVARTTSSELRTTVWGRDNVSLFSASEIKMTEATVRVIGLSSWNRKRMCWLGEKWHFVIALIIDLFECHSVCQGSAEDV